MELSPCNTQPEIRRFKLDQLKTKTSRRPDVLIYNALHESSDSWQGRSHARNSRMECSRTRSHTKPQKGNHTFTNGHRGPPGSADAADTPERRDEGACCRESPRGWQAAEVCSQNVPGVGCSSNGYSCVDGLSLQWPPRMTKINGLSCYATERKDDHAVRIVHPYMHPAPITSSRRVGPCTIAVHDQAFARRHARGDHVAVVPRLEMSATPADRTDRATFRELVPGHSYIVSYIQQRISRRRATGVCTGTRTHSS